ncbi:cation-translocating P-type ATPase [Sinimarinibacterium sp. CAU 1509]|uniref:cation-translocating P-type ATPase n=1 Tax=Sinimarinibacterium sp. CAU 1509 TaxID=2562283 RepID=UPI0010AC9023|nr:cation-translocating P-type ATPase [Sinimarinibacterium sp. CAU 1509]TJY60954.1 cation-translocating P-type ATPase [Sinimarinibacterium sp. CAU 1509]
MGSDPSSTVGVTPAPGPGAGQGAGPGVDPPAADWHLQSAQDSVARLTSDVAQGLAHDEAQARLQQYGHNDITQSHQRGALAMFLAQFTDFMILVLIAAAVIAGVLGDWVDTLAILAIVLINAVVGFLQEYRADRAIAALREMAAPQATVRRAGGPVRIPADEVVPGDIVLTEAGDVVPADLRLLETVQFHSDESSLTGESQPVDKFSAVLPDDRPLAERANMAYKGTLAVRGRAVGLAVATGMRTEIGRIAALLSAQDEVRTPLQIRLARFGRVLSIAVIAICVIVFGAGLLRGEPALMMFLTAVSLAVAAIPEALPAVVTLTLSRGAALMVRANALVRRLPAVETLGSVTYICSDKTGTLTLNRMHAERFVVGDPRRGITRLDTAEGTVLARVLVLNNDARVGEDGTLIGDPTETALVQAAADSGIDVAAMLAQHPRLAELPFDSQRQRMLTLHPGDGGVLALLKGAPETVLPRCSDSVSGDFDRDEITAAAEQLAAEGCRVLAFAQRMLPAMPDDLERAESDLQFVGLVGLIDPPRTEAADAVAAARSAGIATVMITGDHPATAAAIARQVGIIDAEGEVMTGAELNALDDAALDQRVEGIRVYARATPEQKIRIVKALQRRGAFVAVTGDGVNDAPALKSAHIGVAMGRGGTEVAREASDLVLLDDNFATIIAAVREGRHIYDNIRKFVRYVVTTNAAEVLTLFLAPFLGLPLPLLPIQILWINLVSDGLPGLALAAEPVDRRAMARPPRPPGESLFAHGLGIHAIWVGLLMAGVTLLTQAWGVNSGLEHWQSITFTVLTLSQMGHALAIRSETESLFTLGLASNRLLLGAVLLTFVLQGAVLYLPWMNAVFKTDPLSAGELALCLALSSVVFFAVEIEKWMVRRGWLYRDR